MAADENREGGIGGGAGEGRGGEGEGAGGGKAGAFEFDTKFGRVRANEAQDAEDQLFSGRNGARNVRQSIRTMERNIQREQQKIAEAQRTGQTQAVNHWQNEIRDWTRQIAARRFILDMYQH